MAETKEEVELLAAPEDVEPTVTGRFEMLPDDVTELIMGYLGARDLSACSGTAKFLARRSESGGVWRQLYWKDFGMLSLRGLALQAATDSLDARAMYRSRLQERRRRIESDRQEALRMEREAQTRSRRRVVLCCFDALHRRVFTMAMPLCVLATLVLVPKYLDGAFSDVLRVFLPFFVLMGLTVLACVSAVLIRRCRYNTESMFGQLNDVDGFVRVLLDDVARTGRGGAHMALCMLLVQASIVLAGLKLDGALGDDFSWFVVFAPFWAMAASFSCTPLLGYAWRHDAGPFGALYCALGTPVIVTSVLLALRLEGLGGVEAWHVLIPFVGLGALVCCGFCCVNSAMTVREARRHRLRRALREVREGWLVMLVFVLVCGPVLLFEVFLALRLEESVDWDWLTVFVPIITWQSLVSCFFLFPACDSNW